MNLSATWGVHLCVCVCLFEMHPIHVTSTSKQHAFIININVPINGNALASLIFRSLSVHHLKLRKFLTPLHTTRVLALLECYMTGLGQR